MIGGSPHEALMNELLRLWIAHYFFQGLIHTSLLPEVPNYHPGIGQEESARITQNKLAT